MPLAPDGYADRRQQLVGGCKLQHAGERAGRVAARRQRGVMRSVTITSADLVLGREERPPIRDGGADVEFRLAAYRRRLSRPRPQLVP